MPFASESDFLECSRLHRKFGTTYYFASRRLPKEVRRRVDAVYGFVRVPDEWVDNPGTLSAEDSANLLRQYRQELMAAHYGVPPSFPSLRAFADVLRETKIPLEEPTVFLDAMESDLTVSRYKTYAELQNYMRGSAVAVGLMMLYVLEADLTPETIEGATALGEAMQLTNFLRDVGEDYARGRIYIPQAELEEFNVSESMIAGSNVSPEFVRMMKFQIDRARQLFDRSDAAIPMLGEEVRFGVALARELYSKILEKIELNGYDVLNLRARTTPQDKMMAAWKLWAK